MLLLNVWASQAKKLLGSGVALNIRPSSPSDKDEALSFLRSVSAEDLRFRFMSAVQPTEALARILTDVDHRQSERSDRI